MMSFIYFRILIYVCNLLVLYPLLNEIYSVFFILLTLKEIDAIQPTKSMHVSFKVLFLFNKRTQGFLPLVLKKKEIL